MTSPHPGWSKDAGTDAASRDGFLEERMSQAIGKWMTAKQEPRDPKYKTLFWKVYGSDKNQLGVVAWNGTWRQYVFFTEDGIVMSSGCIKSLAEFLDEKNAQHRKGRDDRSLPRQSRRKDRGQGDG